MATATATVVPLRSETQRMDALALANSVRIRRAQLKRDVAAGRTPARDVVLNPPPYAVTMRLEELLMSIPRYGRSKVNRLHLHCRISMSKTLGGLSDRQRDEIAGAL